MLKSIDVFFTVFHCVFILFVLLGWVHPKARKFHILALLLTFTAWLLLGLYVGTIGYCPLTDWHWDVKRSLGETGMSSSFVGYLFEEYANLTLRKIYYDIISVSGLVLGVTMAFYYHFKNDQMVNENRRAKDRVEELPQT